MDAWEYQQVTAAQPRTLIADYGNDTVRDAAVRFIKPVFVPNYANGTVSAIEGAHLRLVPAPQHAQPRLSDSEDDEGHEQPDDPTAVPAPRRHRSWITKV